MQTEIGARVSRELDKEAAVWTAALVSNSCGSIEDYRRIAGILHGLSLAKKILERIDALYMTEDAHDDDD